MSIACQVVDAQGVICTSGAATLQLAAGDKLWMQSTVSGMATISEVEFSYRMIPVG